MSQVITASRLRDGAVVFLGASSDWVEHIAGARVFASAEDTAKGLEGSKASEDENVVLDIYAVDVSEKNGRLVPTRLREAIRASGPTVHPEHGKTSVV